MTHTITFWNVCEPSIDEQNRLEGNIVSNEVVYNTAQFININELNCKADKFVADKARAMIIDNFGDIIIAPVIKAVPICTVKDTNGHILNTLYTHYNISALDNICAFPTINNGTDAEIHNKHKSLINWINCIIPTDVRLQPVDGVLVSIKFKSL